ncbi:MAG: hypothetical protein JW703_05240 [Candidatus Diapherotrites archaeon]|nr:hypothetical protein [Candidatus Diapherotrites archaeon]
MKYNYAFLNELNEKTLLKNRFESLEFAVYLIISIIAPFALMHFQFSNQIIIGSIVNFALASSALYFSAKKLIPLIILPSIAAFLTGIIFSQSSIFLLYFIPFIWIGNFVFVYLIKKIKVIQKKNYAFALSIASLAKSILLFSIALLFVSINLVPEAFLIAMGLMQLVTALIGGSITGIINYVRQK